MRDFMGKDRFLGIRRKAKGIRLKAKGKGHRD
jgi:hypothetical protein